ncbi:hypothetical protein PHYBLDRAFT_78464 [Phycomyces blakesleeanus NRRL 1555(-)]|uniref:Uncharacterized protein n=1 Tax=Phycomyces blakesleeanus (strain ATCC 8743b / DSM 1359 / FGSC 10004 / NBRC 33097 / NRRL 1555) TaxID=763407 RepID=A0A163A5F1_PHYB8|nr:hypothetical protein PHYBLDRAFT_78464 [Phycomyces blakesleeanus NRRL 1555(-)]OAD71201.1 hypothetical protein PHYBLDRAFT_78464 [Phycomyces blakesleeanus NRRL 1555(-)]|eukprot:XP_018289241.1 hypothetical protein PHYBLDRAFT_78464 [Phycomyces blakesleeanus NRRL 1555(-)]
MPKTSDRQAVLRSLKDRILERMIERLLLGKSCVPSNIIRDMPEVAMYAAVEEQRYLTTRTKRRKPCKKRAPKLHNTVSNKDKENEMETIQTTQTTQIIETANTPNTTDIAHTADTAVTTVTAVKLEDLNS